MLKKITPKKRLNAHFSEKNRKKSAEKSKKNNNNNNNNNNNKNLLVNATVARHVRDEMVGLSAPGRVLRLFVEERLRSD